MSDDAKNWKAELAEILDRIGSRSDRLGKEPFTFKNLDELIYQLTKESN